MAKITRVSKTDVKIEIFDLDVVKIEELARPSAIKRVVAAMSNGKSQCNTAQYSWYFDEVQDAKVITKSRELKMELNESIKSVPSHIGEGKYAIWVDGKKIYQGGDFEEFDRLKNLCKASEEFVETYSCTFGRWIEASYNKNQQHLPNDLTNE